MTSRRTTRGVAGLVRAIATKPGLWPVAISTGVSMVGSQWWRHRPFLPVPDRRWLRFRMVTAYGGDGRGRLDVDDVIAFLQWRRTFPG